jgi:hypothetical protein
VHTNNGKRTTRAISSTWQVNGEKAINVVVTYYRQCRIDVVAQFVDAAWNAGVRIRRTLSGQSPHVQQVTCRKSTAIEAEQAGELWGRSGGWTAK